MMTMVNYDFDRLEAIERHGMGDFGRAAPEKLRRELGIVTANREGVEGLAVRARPRSIMWNHAQGFGDSAPATEHVLSRIMGFYELNRTRGAICMTPRASTEEAMAMLDAHGYEPGYTYRKFVRGTAPPPAADSDLTVRPAEPEDARAFGEIVAQGFGTPQSFVPWVAALVGRTGWHCFLAFEGGRPAGTGALYVRDGIGYCTFGATHPDFRRRGAQRALLARRIAEGLKLGCEMFVTETGEDPEKPEQSYRNILWAGFERAYLRDNWVPKANS